MRRARSPCGHSLDFGSQALLHGVDSKQIVSTLFSPNYPQATSVIAASAAGYVNLSDKLKYDPALSKKLLDEAGWKPGPNGIRQKDGKPLALGGLGPQWAVYEADSIAAFKSKPVNERFAACPWGLYYIDVAV